MKRLLSAILLTCAFAGILLAETRTWENQEGVGIEAELLRVEGDDALLRMHGRIFRVPVAKLSASDRAFLTKWQERQNSPPAPRVEEQVKGVRTSRPEPGSKKGLGYSARGDAGWERLNALNVSWFYNWTAREPPGVPEGIDFVPMVFGHAPYLHSAVGHLREVNETRGLDYVLGHNEPDSERQANRTVEEVLDEWPVLMELGLPLVSPGAVNPEGEWMRAFMAGVEERGLRVDFIAVHSYGGANPQGFLNRMERIHELYDRPIWITEFAVGDWSANDVSENRHSPKRVLDFMREVLPELDRRDYIHRYAWFPSTPDNPALGTSALFDEAGVLTPLGEFYAKHR